MWQSSWLASLRLLLFRLKKLKTGTQVLLGFSLLSLLTTALGLILLWRLSVQTTTVDREINAAIQTQGEELTLGKIYVDVSGAVNQPGLYEFNSGDRVAQAVKKAGGFSLTADESFIEKKLNLAQKLTDAEKLYIPTLTDSTPAQATNDFFRPIESASSSSSNRLISINSASLSELDSLPSIGEKRAQDIVDNRPYGQLDELVSREVISQSIFSEIKALISL